MSAAPRPPLVQVIKVTREGDRNRLDLTCGHTVLRRAYMGGTYARARCPECPSKETSCMTERTDLDRMLDALAVAEREGRITVHGDADHRQRLAENLLVGVGLWPL